MEVGETSVKTTTSISGEAAAKASGGISVPLIGALSAEGGGKAAATHASETVTKPTAHGLDRVVAEIGNSAYTIFIDDFHYMKPDVQTEVARKIKEVAERGVRVCTASVPHRSDDVVRSNVELRGRVQAIDFEYWSNEEVKRIPQVGFAALNIGMDARALEYLTREAFGSPQLMQSMCLHTCFELNVDKTLPERREVAVESVNLARILEHTASTTDFSSLLDALHSGPKTRGQERTKFLFQDGTSGDVYRCVLLAIQQPPPLLTLPYDELYSRTRAVCIGNAPVGSSVNEALAQMHKIAEDVQPASKVFEWSESILDITDPYFLFYVRCSTRLKKLARP